MAKFGLLGILRNGKNGWSLDSENVLQKSVTLIQPKVSIIEKLFFCKTFRYTYNLNNFLFISKLYHVKDPHAARDESGGDDFAVRPCTGK